MNKELLKGTLNIIVLLIISKETTYGYEIAKKIQLFSDNQIIIKDSSLYTVLLRLEQLKYITSKFDILEKYPRRKYYHITVEGKKYLNENIKEYQIINSLVQSLI